MTARRARWASLRAQLETLAAVQRLEVWGSALIGRKALRREIPGYSLDDPALAAAVGALATRNLLVIGPGGTPLVRSVGPLVSLRLRLLQGEAEHARRADLAVTSGADEGITEAAAEVDRLRGEIAAAEAAERSRP